MTASTASRPVELSFEALPAVHDALASLGRTEDVRFAPSGRRLALACYAKERIAVADLTVEAADAGPEIRVTRLDVLASADLREPHGLDFLGDETLVVGNRAGGVGVFRLPTDGGDLLSIGAANGSRPKLLDSPGSVAVRSLGAGRYEVLACNNWSNAVTRHTLDAAGALTDGEIVVRKWLDLPDGVAVSDDDRWLAVSNHNTHSVLIYDRAAAGEEADPVGVLRGVSYPHGLRFGAGDRHLLVADAGAPYVHVFAAGANGWRGVGYPTTSITVVGEEAFARGRHNPQEGGPKGIDVHPATNVLAVTAAEVPLAFFDVSAALEAGKGPPAEALVGYELELMAELDRLETAAAAARSELAELLQTKAWRLTKPGRAAYGALRRLRARAR